jgi:NADH-quinone oxidoreductase subunit C
VSRADDLAAKLRDRDHDVIVARGDVSIVVAPGDLVAALTQLRDGDGLGFDLFCDLAATDWPGAEPRFWLAYHLASIAGGHRVRVKVGLAGDEPHVASATGVYPAANWFEREVYDFFGVVFDGHPDLTRIEMPDEWTTYPLRKTEPLAGVRTQYKGGAFVPPPDERGL